MSRKAAKAEAEEITIEEQESQEKTNEEETGEGDEIGKLQDEVETAQAQAAEYLAGWQRAQAEFANYKKRQESDREQMILIANASLLRQLLPVADDFARAVSTIPTSLNKLSWCEGILLIKRKLDAILESAGTQPIETAGQVFDPRYHEAVTYEEAPGYEEGHIIGEVQRGYTLGERVLRPALVRVAKAAVAPKPEQAQGEGDEENKE